MSSHINVRVKAFCTDNYLGYTFPVEAVLTSTLSLKFAMVVWTF